MKKENARNAEKYLKLIDMQESNTVVKHVPIKSITKLGKEKVYNMHVSRFHNFAINNGAIVHNCIDGKKYILAVWRKDNKSPTI